MLGELGNDGEGLGGGVDEGEVPVHGDAGGEALDLPAGEGDVADDGDGEGAGGGGGGLPQRERTRRRASAQGRFLPGWRRPEHVTYYVTGSGRRVGLSGCLGRRRRGRGWCGRPGAR